MCECISVIDADKSRPNESTIRKSLFKIIQFSILLCFIYFTYFGFNKPVMFMLCFGKFSKPQPVSN